jgi:EmrB/QacA subfamily drug resistance transporter
VSQSAGIRLPGPRRWELLVFVSLAQLMVVLDSTVVNIALPSAQHDLGISDADRQWAITAYALAFGGLLLFGGRIADKWGRKRALVIGLIGFALASAIGGLANSEALLFGSRAFQGAFGALLAPAALSLLAVTFTDSRERARAFGVFSAIASAGGAVGLLVGGLLTEYLNWRWTFFVNVPFAIIAALGAYFVIREPEGGRNRSPLDIPGVVLSALGLVSLVYGFTRAESSGWSAPSTIGLLVASGALLAVFAFVESKAKTPLLPLRVLTERNRGGAYASLGLAIIGMFGVFLFLTYYLQVVEGYSAIRTGLAFLPIAIAFIVGATQIGTRLATRLPARMFMVPGFAVAVLGMLLLTRLEVGSSYPGVILPGLILLGLGMGTALMPVISLSTHGIQARDAGVAAAMANTSQQVGGAVGTALLNTIAASATATYLASHTSGTKLAHAQSLVHGYTHAIWWAVGIEAAAALIALTLINVGRPGSTQGASSADGTDTENVLPTGGVMHQGHSGSSGPRTI